MAKDDFHEKPFDEGTITKLEIFELYAREWLPVFLARQNVPAIHLFDFFAGPGEDSAKTPGSPLRLLRTLKEYQTLQGWGNVRIHVHFFDESAEKISVLEQTITARGLRLPGVTFDIRPLVFAAAFSESVKILRRRESAKLVFIDQFGVDHVTPEVFKELTAAPVCDFLFFISSSILHRFRNHPAIKQKIRATDDYYHVHRAVMEFYRSLLLNKQYYLAPFSIKKGANIYGLIFGSAHPLGIDKFLQVTWKTDQIAGEADFDIDRDDIKPSEPRFPGFGEKPTKISIFEEELEDKLRTGLLANEADVMRLCFEHGVKRQHAQSVLSKLKKEGIIELDFRVPDVDRHSKPRPIRMKNKP